MALGEASAVFVAVQPLKSCQVDILVAMKILAIETWAKAHHERFMRARAELSAEMGEPSGPQKWTIPAENLEAFVGKLNALGGEEVAVPAFGRIALSDLKGAKLSPEDLQSLGPFLDLGGEDLSGALRGAGGPAGPAGPGGPA